MAPDCSTVSKKGKTAYSRNRQTVIDRRRCTFAIAVRKALAAVALLKAVTC